MDASCMMWNMWKLSVVDYIKIVISGRQLESKHGQRTSSWEM